MLNQYVHLWSFADLNERERLRGMLPEIPDWQDVRQGARHTPSPQTSFHFSVCSPHSAAGSPQMTIVLAHRR